MGARFTTQLWGPIDSLKEHRRERLGYLYDTAVRLKNLLEFELRVRQRLRARGLHGSDPPPSTSMRALSMAVGLLVAGLHSPVEAQERQPIQLPAPTRVPLSWQRSLTNGAARPAPPGGLQVVPSPTSREISGFVGDWTVERSAAGKLCSFTLSPEGLLTARFAVKTARTNDLANGTWEVIGQAIRFRFASQTNKASIPAFRETTVTIVRDGVGTVLVGEENSRFVRGKMGEGR